MKIEQVKDYHEMSLAGARLIHDAVVKKLAAGKEFNLGLATGNTMIELYRILAGMFNAENVDLSRLSTWNLDEYAVELNAPVPYDHPLSYRKYMHDNFFDRLNPQLGFSESTRSHFPDPADPGRYDVEIEAAGGVDFQLLGIGFNGHIAFNEPMKTTEIAETEFASLPSRVLALTELTLNTNARLTADGKQIVPRYAATMGMKPILAARQILLLACFPEQKEPLQKMLDGGEPTPELPASYLLKHADSHIIYTADQITLERIK